MSKMIPLSAPNLKGNEKKYVENAITNEWVSTAGSFISDFEEAICNYTKSKHATACQSGTSALHLALLIKGIGNGQEVIVPTLTFVAAVNPVKYVGADTVFMDCDDTLCMDMDKLEKFCITECEFIDGKLYNKTSKKHVAAVVVVHVFGNLANMEKLMDISHRFNLYIIEDATEALGSYYLQGRYKGKFAGTIGNIGAYSFNGNKIITTGGGGMLVSNDNELIKRAKYLGSQAKDDLTYFKHSEIGYNYRMTNIQAAVGLAQLEQLEDFIKTKTDNYNYYKKLGLKLLNFRDDIRPNYWFYSYHNTKRDELIKYLGEKNVQSRPIWQLIHTLLPYQKSQIFQISKAPKYLENIVNLPCSSNLEKDDIAIIVQYILEFQEREAN